MTDDAAGDNRCGYEPVREEFDPDSEAEAEWLRERWDSATCWREPWDGGRCIWHADVKDKPADELQRARADEWEVLDGAVLNRVEFDDRMDFTGSRLRWASGEEVTLEGANFDGANLRDAQFSDAVLQEAQFSDAVLRGAQFPDADLQKAKFPEADLQMARFPDADLQRAKFPDADLRKAKFPDADLLRARFLNATLQEAQFRNADIIGTQFPDADLIRAQFPDAYLWEAQFPDADLSGAQFPDAVLLMTQFPDANLRHAQFPDAGLARAQFPHASLTKARFNGADLGGAQLHRVSLTEAELQNADLTGVQARGAVFHKADLTGAVLRDAILRDANLEDTRLNEVDLGGAQLQDARLYQTVLFDALVDPTTDFGDSLIYERSSDLNGWFRNTADATPMQAAAWVHRNLQQLYEDNAMADEARQFHIQKEEAQRERRRREVVRSLFARGDRTPRQAPGHLLRYVVGTTNRYLTYHGESLANILLSAGAIILACGLLYPFVGGIASDSTGARYEFTPGLDPTKLVAPESLDTLAQTLYFSVITFSTIGYGDLYPASWWSKVLVGVESLSGALLVALFVFVLGGRWRDEGHCQVRILRTV
jgi:uncharacterized protein YjbI with pentapeptide repeats